MSRLSSHHLGLAAAVLIGALLRFWNLDLKALWLDETITALFSLGHTYYEVPIATVRPLADFQSLFQWQPSSCAAIAAAVRQQSTHPPLFFCWLHQWLGWIDHWDVSLAWKLRSLPALLGTLTIPIIYRLNRVAFSPAAGVAAAALMAVSPFAVYLSQEARHYTLPMLLMTLSLVGFVLMLQELWNRQMRPGIWIGWVLLNGLGLYTHYFFGLIVMAQVLTLLQLVWWHRDALPQRIWGVLGLAIAGIVLLDAPLLPQLIEHLQQPATDWLNLATTGLESFTPLLRLLAGTVVMTSMLPIEEQPLGVTIGSGLIMLLFTSWLGWRSTRGMRRLWRNPTTRLSLLILGSVLGWLLLQYLIVIYGLGKDLTLAFRYHFILYPPICALLGASLTAPPALEWGEATLKVRPRRLRRDLSLVTAVGLISSVCVVSGLAFLKPFQPQQIVQRLQISSNPLIVQTHESWQSIAFGLSLIANVPPTPYRPTWVFQPSNRLGTFLKVKERPPHLWWFSSLTTEPSPPQLTLQVGNQGQETCLPKKRLFQCMNIRYLRYGCTEK